jgi:dipeptidyl aminopeptidase/acylaminoacyl peptidase
MPVKKTAKKNKKTFKPPLWLYLIVGFLLLSLAWWHLGPKNRIDLSNAGGLIEGRSESDDAYKSLDLREAAKATYASSPISILNNLGISDDVNHQIVRFKVVKDSLNEYGLMTLPAAPPPEEGYPVLILCHGYYNPLYYPTEKAYLGDMEFYSQNGFAVIKPDFRGQGLSLAEGRPEGAYYSMAYNTDVMSLISAIKQTSYLNKSNINIWGHSMGAYIALRAAVLSNDIKTATLLSGPVGNIQDMYTSYVAISDANNSVAASIRADQLARHGTPVSNPSYWDNASPLSFLDHTKAFIQIHVGTADQLVPPRFSADLDNALNRAHKAHEYFIYPDGQHGLISQRDVIWQRSLDRIRSKT